MCFHEGIHDQFIKEELLEFQLLLRCACSNKDYLAYLVVGALGLAVSLRCVARRKAAFPEILEMEPWMLEDPRRDACRNDTSIEVAERIRGAGLRDTPPTLWANVDFMLGIFISKVSALGCR